MAIKPETLLKLETVPLSEIDEKLLGQVENEIDQFLMVNFERNHCPYFILTEKLSSTALHELLRRYREAGWNVVAWTGHGNDSTLIYFAQAKRKPIDAPQRIQGTH